jgi:hypothetical protein
MKYSSRKTSSSETTDVCSSSYKKNTDPSSSKKNKNKAKQLAKVFSAPIRRLYKRGRTTTTGGGKNKKDINTSEQLKITLEDHQELHQHREIRPVDTFDTEDVVISPVSITSLTVGNSFSYIHNIQEIHSREQYYDQTHETVEELQQQSPSRSMASLPFGDCSSYIYIQEREEEQEQDSSIDDEQPEDNSTGSSPEWADLEANLNEFADMIKDEDEENISTEDEVDSLVPAMDKSLFFDELEDDDDVVDNDNDFNPPSPYHLPTKRMAAVAAVARPSVEILGISINCDMEENHHEEDVVSLTSSHNSYLQAIESITGSISCNTKKAVGAVMYQSSTVTPRMVSEVEEEEGDYKEYRVSFTPSNELYLQAMEGASEKAKLDIERATALALSKINTTTSFTTSYNKDEVDNKTKNASRVAVAVGYTHNRVLGSLFFVFLIFNWSGNSHQLLDRIQRSVSRDTVVDSTAISQQHNVIIAGEQSQLSTWIENQIIGSTTTTNDEVVLKINKTVHNVACADALPCLALSF